MHNTLYQGEENSALRQAIAALRSQGVLPGIGEALRRSTEATAAQLRDAIGDEVPAYTDTANPDIRPELRAHVDDLLAQVLAILSDGQRPDFEAFSSHAAHRAAQRFPLEALLHTYRCAHKVLFAWIRDAAVEAAPADAHVRRVVAAAAEFAIEFTDSVSTTATSSYVDQTRLLAEAQGNRRAELLTLLLHGYDEADTHAAQLLRKSGYLEQRQSYCVLVARSVNPDEMRSSARARRMADAIADALGPANLRTLVDVRDNHVVAVLSATRRQSGWTAPQSRLADRLLGPLRLVGPAALIGLSNDVPSTSHIPRAAAQARVALDLASVAERVKAYSTVSLRQLLLSAAGRSAGVALPPWTGAFASADARSRGRLAATVKAYAGADMNVQLAARRLGVHPNTIYARARRVEDLTGVNLLTYDGLTELLLAIEANL
jgi:sugar diacid utilization regulator